MGVPDLKKLCVKYEFDIKGLTVKRQLLELLRGQPVSEHTPKVRGSALPREPAPRLGPRWAASPLTDGPVPPLSQPRQPKAKAKAKRERVCVCGGCDEGDVCGECETDGEGEDVDPRMMMCGPNPTAQARDLLLLAETDKVQELKQAMMQVGYNPKPCQPYPSLRHPHGSLAWLAHQPFARRQDPKKTVMWLVEQGAERYLGTKLDCFESPLVQALVAKAEAKTSDEIEPLSLEFGQCPCAAPHTPCRTASPLFRRSCASSNPNCCFACGRLGGEEIAKFAREKVGLVVCNSVFGRDVAHAAIKAFCARHGCPELYEAMIALNMIIRCTRKCGKANCAAGCSCTAWNGTPGSECLARDVGYQPAHERAPQPTTPPTCLSRTVFVLTSRCLRRQCCCLAWPTPRCPSWLPRRWPQARARSLTTRSLRLPRSASSCCARGASRACRQR